MKRKEQALRYIARHTFEADEFSKVKADFLKTYDGSIVKQSPRPTDTATYDDYQKWLVYEVAAGDVVEYGNTIGIFSDDNHVDSLAAYIGIGGKLVVGSLEVPKCRLRKVDLGKTDGFLMGLSDIGLQFSDRYSVLMRISAPKVMKRVGFTYNGIFGAGVIGSTDRKTTRFLFSVLQGVYSEGWEVPTDRLVFRELSFSEIRNMDLVLEKNGKAWNNVSGKFMLAGSRVEVGETYWFIDERFNISSATENRARKDEQRHRCGNYFTAYQEAIEFWDAFHRLRDRQKNGEDISLPRLSVPDSE